jgi:predicted alpha/beta-fold hydrolase
LLLNALDDPFLPDACYPEIQTGFVRVFYTRFGGHVGFANDLRLQNFFHEEIALRLTI